MPKLPLLVSVFAILTACSEVPVEEQGEEAVLEMENQIEGDAKSLEEAADEAVKVLQSEIEQDLSADGFTRSNTTEPAAEDSEEQE
ncbi:hypothetical protein [Sphingorhabdus sp. Alg231-15]|uniref:hypothetical protein n=1 Tax=Sphingorhabdus sp. Alg231-15 TaxID=1922222 RepID=UPI000D56023A